MRSTCQATDPKDGSICGLPLVSDLSGSAWFHVLPGRLALSVSEPVVHRAQPGRVKHTCSFPDLDCPRCRPDEARAWIREQRSTVGRPTMPGVIA